MGHLSYTGLFVLQAFAQGHRFGFDIMEVPHLPSRSVYPRPAHVRLPASVACSR